MNGDSLKLALGPSSGLTWLLSGGHVAAAVLVWLALPPLWSLTACAALIASLAFALGRHARRSAAAAVVEVTLRGQDGRADLLRRDGARLQGRLLPSTFVSPALVILNLAGERWPLPRAILVPADALAANDHRRLRVWLRWRPFAADMNDGSGFGQGVN